VLVKFLDEKNNEHSDNNYSSNSNPVCLAFPWVCAFEPFIPFRLFSL